MENWKQYIVTGDQAFQSGDHSKALVCYKHASNDARQQLGSWYDTQAVLSAMVVTDLKIAEVQCREECFEEAIETYSTLSLDLRRFQCCFAQSNPISNIVTQAISRVKQEFLNMTKVYAYDILASAKHSPL